jgi:hypothetical protein
MSFVIARVVQAAAAAAVLETAITAAYPFHPFYPLSIAIYAILATLIYLVIVCIAALIATRVPVSAGWTQKFVFFVLVVAPPLFSSYFFFRNVSFYSLGGRPLVAGDRITTAGFEHLLTDLGIDALLALVAALIYFRANPQPTQT